MQQKPLQTTRLTQISRHFQALSEAQALLTRQPTSACNNANLLEFHAIITPDAITTCLNNSAWLNEVQHIAYQYQRSNNTKRMLFSDGILCDVCLHASDTLQSQQAENDATNWSVMWEKPNFHVTAYPQSSIPPLQTKQEWLLGELLTNLALGLRYFANGAKLAAFQCIQQRALNHFLTLVASAHSTEQAPLDCEHLANINWEQKFPKLAQKFQHLACGYDASPSAAQNIIEELSRLHNINHFIKDQILNLIAACLNPVERN